MKTLYNNLYLMKMVYAADKKRIFLLILQSVIAGLKNIIGVMFIKLALDCIVVHHSFLYLVLLVAAERIVSSILSYAECSFQWKECPVSDQKIRKALMEAVYGKSLEVGLWELDNPEFYDKWNRAVEEAEQRPFLMLDTLGRFLADILTIVSISTILVILDWKLMVLGIASAVIGFFVNLLISRRNFEKNRETTRAERKMGYVRRIFYLPQYAEEMKTNNYKDLLFSKLEEGSEEYCARIKKYQPATVFLDVIKNWQLFVLNFGLGALLIGRDILRGTTQAASFTSLIYACTTFSGSLSDLFFAVSQMREHGLFIDNLREILDYKSQMEPAGEALSVQDTGSSHSLVLEHVSFRYGSGHEDTLKDISMTIHRGEKIALVGENGAGKSTLVKLLLRLYDPQSGSLYLDGIHYKDLELRSLRQAVSVVYQNFQSLAFSIGENVLTKEMQDSSEAPRIWEALKESGLYAKVKELPEQLNTPLTNEFEENGINLSGGENQKLAIARAVYRESGVLIMDEPSSSLDPVSEQEMYQRMYEQGKDKTLILISHRLYSTKMADKIYYLEKGSIVESGNHEELMRLGGKYARLYTAQAEQYAGR